VRRASWPELPAQGKEDADRPVACSPSTARKGGVDADGPVARAPNAAGEEGAHGPAARRRSQRGWGGRAGRAPIAAREEGADGPAALPTRRRLSAAREGGADGPAVLQRGARLETGKDKVGNSCSFLLKSTIVTGSVFSSKLPLLSNVLLQRHHFFSGLWQKPNLNGVRWLILPIANGREPS